jgi:hypothetical protein
MMICFENIVVDVRGNVQRKASNRAPVHAIAYRPNGYRTIWICVKGKEIHSAVCLWDIKESRQSNIPIDWDLWSRNPLSRIFRVTGNAPMNERKGN